MPRTYMRRPRRPKHDVLPRRPGLRTLTLDLAVGVFLAWLLPDGVNLLLGLFSSRWKLGATGLSGVEVVALTTFVLFGLQNVAWVNGAMATATENIGQQLDEWAEISLPTTLSSTLLNEMASHILGRGESSPSYTRGLELYTNAYGNLPREVRLGAPLLLSRELQRWKTRCEELRTGGIDIPQEEQVALIAELCRSASTFLLIDPVLYEDITKDWTRAWRDLVAGELGVAGVRLEYVYMSTAADDKGMSRHDQARLDTLATFMTDHKWKFYTCEKRDISATAPPAAMHERLLEVFDDDLIISMPKTKSFTTGALTRTRLSIADDDETRFIEAVRKYRQPYDSSRRAFEFPSRFADQAKASRG